jgi:hypothetical protein
MKSNSQRPAVPFLAAALVAVAAMVASALPARADSAPVTKGHDVTTVGTDPYLGLTAAELAKLAQLQGEPPTTPAEPKAAPAATIGANSPHPLNPAEQAKLAAMVATVRTLPLPIMVKLALMQVATTGTQVLTPQEREKHANEATRHDLAAPTSPRVVAPSPAPRSGR